jgi:serine phosphatase RsbU (regulator of sigma subunit)
MPALEIPPWLQAADPAAHMARGMQIGVQLGAQRAAEAAKQQQAAERAQEFQQQMSAEQAAQQFKMQQAARAEQMQAQEQARADAELQLKSSMAADKSKAILQYQESVKGGMDPLQAILQYGCAPIASHTLIASPAVCARECGEWRTRALRGERRWRGEASCLPAAIHSRGYPYICP